MIHNTFPGFKEVVFEKFWVYPNFLEEYWCQMTGSEQKILDFLMRQTIGFRKQKDRISLSQFTSGIGEKNKGIGLSKSQTQRAIKSLEQKGFIVVEHHKNRPSSFSLKYEIDNRAPMTQEKFKEMFKHLKHPLNK